MPDTHLVGWVPSQLENKTFTSSSSSSENRFVPWCPLDGQYFVRFSFCDWKKWFVKAAAAGGPVITSDDFLRMTNVIRKEVGVFKKVISHIIFPSGLIVTLWLRAQIGRFQATPQVSTTSSSTTARFFQLNTQLWITSKGDVGTGQDHRRLHRAQRRLVCGEEHQGNGCL